MTTQYDANKLYIYLILRNGQYEHYDDEQEYEMFLFHNNNFNPAITV